MIDSHCHLDHEPMFSDLRNVLIRSKEIGVEKILTICTSSQSFANILSIIDMDPMIYGTFGIHPHESTNDVINKETIRDNLKHKKIIGIGETGLDFYYNNSQKSDQIKSFEKHIEISIEKEIPLIVHSRNAEDKTFDILNHHYKNIKNNEKNFKILMHCFTGSYEFAKKLLNLNSYFSASGIITFKNSIDLQETFKKIPENKLLIETDSPFLSPVPMRGKKNEPSFIKYTLEKLSQLKEIDFDKMDKITTSNFNSLFFTYGN